MPNRCLYRKLMLAVLFAAAAAGLVGLSAQSLGNGFVETDLVVNQQVSNVPTLTDANGIVHVAQFFDPNLVNPWGISESATSPFWVSDNGRGVATLYNTAGTPQSLVVSIPVPGDPLSSKGTPTGTVFNTASGQQAFMISGVTAAGAPVSAPALFLFATEDGTIAGWNPSVNPQGFDPAKAGTYAVIVVDNSAQPTPTNGAVYKGLAIATNTSSGETFLYATNFRAGTVEIYDTTFKRVGSSDAFTDPKLPKGYAPFNVAALPVNGTTGLFVTYALQDEQKQDDVAGQGHGIVNTFDLSGLAVARFAQHGQLDSPWGVAVAPSTFGPIAGDILIGNFGNGHINVFDPASGTFLDKLRNPHGQAIVIDGLWALKVGNGGNGGDPGSVYFTAGPNQEQDGLFGRLNAAPAAAGR
jgi:uncharacterized protein (TIGR03118 family)